MSMTEFLFIIQNLFQSIGKFFALKFWPSFLLPLFGMLFGFDNTMILRALLFLLVFDFFTGIIAAKMTKEPIKSKTAVRSAFKTAMYGLLVSTAHLTEQITPIATFIEEAVITFLALTEMISIIENVGKMGYAIPRKLLRRLQSLRDEETSVTEKITVKEKVNPETNVKETHTVQETKVESHIKETPHNPTNI